jgi:phospholipase C
VLTNLFCAESDALPCQRARLTFQSGRKTPGRRKAGPTSLKRQFWCPAGAGKGALLLTASMHSLVMLFGQSTAAGEPTSSIPIKNFIFIIQENHSFDHYFGTFPGANGIPAGKMLPDYPGGPPVEKPFLGQASVPDMSHSWVAVKLALDNGAMDGFFWAEWPAALAYYGKDINIPQPNPNLVKIASTPKASSTSAAKARPGQSQAARTTLQNRDTNSPADRQEQELSPNGFADDEDPDVPLSGRQDAQEASTPGSTPPPLSKRPSWVKNTFSYLDNTVIPNYWEYAQAYTLCDSFFSSLEGPSLPNHLYAIAAQSGGLVYNYPNNGLHGRFNFFFPSIVELLGNANVSWKYYNGSAASPTRESLWNPLPGFQKYLREQGSHIDLLSYLFPTSQFYKDLQNGTLPQVSYLTPSAAESEHPPYDVTVGMWYVTGLVNAVMQSNYWQNCAIIIVWDDYGGFYDHVPPKPQSDGFGYGFRVPALVISPYSNVGIVHETYDLTSLLKLVETAFGLPSLTGRDGKSNTMLDCFNFSQAPLPPIIITPDTKLDFSKLKPTKP